MKSYAQRPPGQASMSRIHVGENRLRAAVSDRIGRCNISKIRHDHFVARFDVESEQRRVKRDCSVRDGDGVRDAAEAGELRLKRFDVFATAGNPTGFQAPPHILFSLPSSTGSATGMKACAASVCVFTEESLSIAFTRSHLRCRSASLIREASKRGRD